MVWSQLTPNFKNQTSPKGPSPIHLPSKIYVNLTSNRLKRSGPPPPLTSGEGPNYERVY